MIHFLTTVAQLFPTPSSLPTTEASSNLITTIFKVVFGASAMIAVLMVTIAGFQYVISSGDPQKTTKAKNTILYAVIGLVIAISGYSIVTFVIERIIG